MGVNLVVACSIRISSCSLPLQGRTRENALDAPVQSTAPDKAWKPPGSMIIRRIAGERVYLESVVFAGAWSGTAFVVIGSPAPPFFSDSPGLLQPAAAPAKHAANTAHSTLVFQFMTVPLPMRQP